ncbi:MAG TPA: SpaA isopeptide-forming pilin-related protein [Acidimicrobiales bacterium]|nr:SpaA isopeptide-forming pilin-related protein [Acidimicrobiales bacterium]
MALALVSAIAAVNAVSVGPGTTGGFEADGNLPVNVAGSSDWTTVSVTPVVDDTLDTGFQGSSKEEEPAGWVCNTGGADPPKGDILHVYANLTLVPSPTGAFLNLAFVRASGLGDTHLNFEFNKQTTPPPPAATGPCPINRSVNDFLLTYDFPGGSDPANIRAWTWNGSHWVEHALQAGDATAATNAGTITDSLSGNISVAAREFGELSLNLLAAGLEGIVGCPANSAVVNVRSRSSESITSALQDKLPTTSFSLSTCGSVLLHKVDDHVPAHPLAGATFGLYANPTATGSAMATCLSAADGTCRFDSVAPGNYSVKEISAPAGYTADPSVRTLTVTTGAQTELTAPFVDPRDTGYLRIVKQLRDESGAIVTPADPHALDGTSFAVYRDANHNSSMDAGEQAALWPAETTPAACTITGGAGHCDTGPLPTGAYRVHETVAPTGTTAGPDVNATVSKGTAGTPTTVTYVNVVHPLNIGLVKSGPPAAHVGDVITYTFSATTSGPRLHGIALVDLAPTGCTGPISGPTGDNGDGFLVSTETWQWTCTHTITGADPDPLPNSARVSGIDDFGRSVDATADHLVDILKPAIHIVKSGASSAHEGDVVTYSFAVTNTGDTALTGVEVTDDRLGTVGTIGSLAIGATTTLTKNFTIPAGDAVDNIATACGDDPLQREVCDDDSHHLVVIHPGIHIVKSGASSAHEGDVVTYSFAVTNTGDVPLTGVDVTDDRLGTVGTIGSLAIGATTTLTKNFTIPAGDAVDNTATACGDDPLQREVCDDDTHHLVVIHPSVTIVKSGASSAHEGDVVFYTFLVTNTGDVPLTKVVVTDDILGTVGVPVSLAVGGSTTLTMEYTVPAGAAVDNTATACGDDPLELEVCDDDSHHLVVIHPGIDVVKSGPATAHVGDVVTYSFAVTNTGDVALTNVAVTDDKLGAIGTIESLAVGATTTLTKDFTVPAGDAVDNVVTACGDDPLELEVCGDDDHHLVVIHPAIEVVKSAVASANAGDVVTYSFAVTNTGDVALTNVAVTDDKLGAIGTIPSLAVGATTTLTKAFTVPAGVASVTNIATACGDDPLTVEVCDTDDHVLSVIAVLGEEIVRGEELPRTGLETTGRLLGTALLVMTACLYGRIRRRVITGR